MYRINAKGHVYGVDKCIPDSLAERRRTRQRERARQKALEVRDQRAFERYRQHMRVHIAGIYARDDRYATEQLIACERARAAERARLCPKLPVRRV